MSNFDLALSIVLGVGLAAATMLIGHLPLDAGFAWLGTPAALAKCELISSCQA
jgi:hypothetical protein